MQGDSADTLQMGIEAKIEALGEEKDGHLLSESQLHPYK